MRSDQCGAAVSATVEAEQGAAAAPRKGNAAGKRKASAQGAPPGKRGK